jgi:hypothetical protein
VEETFAAILKDTPWIGFMVYVVHKTLPLFREWIESQSKITVLLGRAIRVLEEVEDLLQLQPEEEKEE